MEITFNSSCENLKMFQKFKYIKNDRYMFYQKAKSSSFFYKNYNKM